MIDLLLEITILIILAIIIRLNTLEKKDLEAELETMRGYYDSLSTEYMDLYDCNEQLKSELKDSSFKKQEIIKLYEGKLEEKYSDIILFLKSIQSTDKNVEFLIQKLSEGTLHARTITAPRKCRLAKI